MTAVTVIIPVFNAADYLDECLNSVFAQTFTDYELILVDDGSSDGSGEICDAFAARDPRVRVIHQTNAGQSAARNRGVRETKTELICFIDADDAVNPALLESFVRLLRETGAGAAVCARVRGETPPPGFFEPKPSDAALFTADEQNLLRLFREGDTLYWTLFPCLLKKSVYEKYPLAEGRVMEDNAVACKWLMGAGTVVRLESPLYFYRENPTGTMNAPFSEKKLDYLWALEEQLAFFKECCFSELLCAVAKHYTESAVWLSSRVRNELQDKKLARAVLRNCISVRGAYSSVCPLSPAEKRKLFKAAHPVLFKLRKLLSRFLPRPQS